MTTGQELIRQARELALAGANDRIGEAAQLADQLVDSPGEGWKQQRTITLPTDAIGHLEVWNPQRRIDRGTDPWRGAGRDHELATGDITIPAGTAVELCITRATDEAIAALSRMRGGDIQALMVLLDSGTLPDGFLRAIAHLTDLRRISINDALIDPRRLRRLRFVEHLDLARCTGFDADSLTHLAAMTRLSTLDLRGVDAPSSAFARMPQLASLTEFRASDTLIDRAGLARIAPSAPTLTVLDIARTGVAAPALRALPPMPNLELLDFAELVAGDDDIRTLINGTKLVDVNLFRTQITNVTLLRLTQHTDLRNLRIMECEGIDDRGVTQLHRCEELELLWFGRTAARGKCLEAISTLPKLRNLSVCGLWLTSADFRWLRRASKLTSLWAYGNPGLTDSAVASVIENLPSLWGLGFSQFRIGEKTTRAIASRPWLTDLTLTGNYLTTQMVRHIASCRELEVLDLRSCQLTDAKGEHLGRLHGLRELVLEGNTQIGDRTAAALAKLRHLRHLDLHGTSVSDAGMTRCLPHLANLTMLCVEDTKIGDATLAALAPHERLITLNIGGTAITDTGIAHLTALTSLQQITLRDTAISDDAMGTLATIGTAPSADDLAARIASEHSAESTRPSGSPGNALALMDQANLPALQRADNMLDQLGIDLPRTCRSALRSIDLRRTDITDDALTALAAHRHLESVDLTGCDTLTNDAVERMRLRRPNTRFEWRPAA